MKLDISGSERAFLDALIQNIQANPKEVLSLPSRKLCIMAAHVEAKREAALVDGAGWVPINYPTEATCINIGLADKDVFNQEQLAIIQKAVRLRVKDRFRKQLENYETAEIGEVQGLFHDLALSGRNKYEAVRRNYALLEFYAFANYLNKDLKEIKAGKTQLFVAYAMETFKYDCSCTELIEERIAKMKKVYAQYFPDNKQMAQQIADLETRYQPLRDRAATYFLGKAIRRDIAIINDLSSTPQRELENETKAAIFFEQGLQALSGKEIQLRITNVPQPPKRSTLEIVKERLAKEQQELATQQTKLKQLGVAASSWSGKVKFREIFQPKITALE